MEDLSLIRQEGPAGAARRLYGGMCMNIIVNVDNNWAIGNKNRLLVSIPNDMKHFREETTGKVVVLGRKTDRKSVV